MRAMIFEQVGEPLRAVELETPSPGPGELLLRVHACGALHGRRRDRAVAD
jgi:NADPH:quinone reductase-like Zn-dependent oxidoreductase